MTKQAPSGNGLWIVAAGIGALLFAERRWARRRRTQAEPERVLRNLALGAMSLAVVGAVQRPLALPLAERVAAQRLGLVQALPLSPLARDLLAVLALDYATYHWHVATHRVPWLWRLHLVHHVDLDMDATTALRFHAVDMLVSVPLRLAEVRLLGVSPRALGWYEGLFFASVLFHHANLNLPFDADLSALVTTPGMHDIHHRADAASLDANFSSGLSLWDRLHGTFSDAQPDVGIGVPGHALPADLATLVALPFAAPSRAITA